MASTIESSWARATTMIETPLGSRGTGFFVGRRTGPDQWKIILVTNKHVLHADPAARASIQNVNLHLNVANNGELAKFTLDYRIRSGTQSAVIEHPDPNIDVLAIDGGSVFQSVPNLANIFVAEDMFATAAKRRELDITAGEDVIVVGYPSAIRQGKTNAPLIRQGLIASRIGEELHEEAGIVNGQMTYRVTRGFLYDGAAIPGTSGSPIVLKPTPARRIGNNTVIGEAPPVLLGIVAETRFAPVGNLNSLGFAGLGLAFDVETIVEVLDLLP